MQIPHRISSPILLEVSFKALSAVSLLSVGSSYSMTAVSMRVIGSSFFCCNIVHLKVKDNSFTPATRAITSPDLRTVDFPFPNLMSFIKTPLVLLSTQVTEVSMQVASLFQKSSQCFPLTRRSSHTQLQEEFLPKLKLEVVGFRQCMPHKLVNSHHSLPSISAV